MSKIYGVYDQEEQCRYVGTAKEIAEEFNCSRTAIVHNVKRGTRIKKKYDVIELYEEGKNDRSTENM